MGAALARAEHVLEVDYIVADVVPGFQVGPLFGRKPHRIEGEFPAPTSKPASAVRPEKQIHLLAEGVERLRIVPGRISCRMAPMKVSLISQQAQRIRAFWKALSRSRKNASMVSRALPLPTQTTRERSRS